MILVAHYILGYLGLRRRGRDRAIAFHEVNMEALATLLLVLA